MAASKIVRLKPAVFQMIILKWLIVTLQFSCKAVFLKFTLESLNTVCFVFVLFGKELFINRCFSFFIPQLVTLKAVLFSKGKMLS